jgi:Domain of unknown function (DUF4276)
MYQAPAIVVVIVEGESEERFLRQVVTPYLSVRGVILKPQQMPTSQASKGGAINLDRLKNHAHKTLNKEKGCYLSTFFDLYALDASITSLSESPLSTDPLLRSTQIEQALAASLRTHTSCRLERLIPYIQPYELEGLFFSDAKALCNSNPNWSRHIAQIQAVRDKVESPEHINNGFDTKPSNRLATILQPAYRKKSRNAPLIGEQIGLSKIMQECKHFNVWVKQLAVLKPLA